MDWMKPLGFQCLGPETLVDACIVDILCASMCLYVPLFCSAISDFMTEKRRRQQRQPQQQPQQQPQPQPQPQQPQQPQPETKKNRAPAGAYAFERFYQGLEAEGRNRRFFSRALGGIFRLENGVCCTSIGEND